jgi:hypothetical protein
MELMKEHKREIEKIVAETDCPKDFCCYKSEPENLPPVTIWRGANVIQCHQADRLNCPNANVFYGDIVFCECPVLRYEALSGEGRKKEPNKI